MTNKGGVEVRVGGGIGVGVYVSVGTLVIVGVRVGVLGAVNVGEGVWVATSADTNDVQAVKLANNTREIMDNEKKSFFILIQPPAS
jgi:UDP-3-O-[3-hydroxymyristoyl] glucosamine N-acyltransferase